MGTQGKCFLSAATATWSRNELLTKIKALKLSFKMHCHFAPIFGIVTACLGLSLNKVLQMFLFLTLRSLISSGVRLNVVGPNAGQRIQAKIQIYLQHILNKWLAKPLKGAYSSNPLISLSQQMHDRQNSRLFNS